MRKAEKAFSSHIWRGKQIKFGAIMKVQGLNWGFQRQIPLCTPRRDPCTALPQQNGLDLTQKHHNHAKSTAQCLVRLRCYITTQAPSLMPSSIPGDAQSPTTAQETPQEQHPARNSSILSTQRDVPCVQPFITFPSS